MFLSKFFKILGFLSNEPNYDLSGVYSSSELAICLQRARAQTDRNDRCFSVVIFKPTEELSNIKEMKRFLGIISKRVRMTDIVGWFDKLHIAVLLQDTSTAGAWKFAHDISGYSKGVTPLMEYIVYTYPSQCISNNNGEKGDSFLRRNDDALSKFLGIDSVGSSSTDNKRHGLTSNCRLAHLFSHPIPWWKRIFDLVLSCVALICLLPFFLFIGILIKSVSYGPIFFKQQRIGYLDKPFTMWKFRTMKVNSDIGCHKDLVFDLIENEKPMYKLDNDPQIIPLIGKLLRKSCIDELPQLFNVICGEMSLVGPRPCLPYEYEQYLQWHKRRFDTLPGMTGLWQVSGKNCTSFRQMIRFDITYEQHKSLWLDIKIILKTLPAIANQIIENGEKDRKTNGIIN